MRIIEIDVLDGEPEIAVVVNTYLDKIRLEQFIFKAQQALIKEYIKEGINEPK
jgi:hypothetical protein